MQISKTMVKYYIEQVTVVYFGDHTQPPEELADYDDSIDNMRLIAESNGDLPWLKLAFQYLLSDPDTNLTEYRGVYPFQSDQVREILEHIWSVVWPGEEIPAPGEGVEVELAHMSVDDWAEIRQRYAAS